MTDDASPENLRKNLFPNVKIDPNFSINNDEDYALSLADEIADQSCRVAEMLGEIGDKSAVKPLIRLLNGEIEGHIYRVMCTNDYEYDFVSDFYDLDNPTQRQELSELLSESEHFQVERTIMAAAEALGKIGDKRVIEPLIQALEKAQQRKNDIDAQGEIVLNRLPLYGMQWSEFSLPFRDALVKLGVDEKKLEQYFPEEEVEDPKEGILAYLSHVKSSLKDSKVTNDLKESISKLESSEDIVGLWNKGTKIFLESHELPPVTRCQGKTRSGRCRRKVHGIYCHSHLQISYEKNCPTTIRFTDRLLGNPVAKFFAELEIHYNAEVEEEKVREEAEKEAEAKEAEREAKKFWRKASGTKYKSKSAPSSKPGDWVSATKTRNFMNRDPILDWLDLYGNEENKDTKDKKYDANLDFVQLLFRKGHEFEKKLVNHLKEKFISAKFVTVGANSADSKDPAKEQETLQHMKDGVPFILQGVLRNPDNKTYGMPDIMVRNDILSKIPENEEYQSFFNIDASSELGNYHYRIIDVKFTTLNYNADGTYLLGSDAHKAQLAIYNQALGRMQGFLPPEAYLLGRNWKRTKNGIEISGEGALDRLGVVDFFNIDRDFIQKANDAVEWIRRVRSEGSAWEVTPKPTVEELWPNCKNQSDYPWHNAKAKIADELNELTKVWQIGPRERERAHANGIFGWNDPDLTPEKIGITGPKRVKIMREVLNINNQDKVKVLPPKIFNNDRNWQKKPKLEFFVDFETVSNIEDDFVNFPRQGGQELIFMIGCGFERNRKFEIKVFTAKNLSIEEEARIITEWFDYMEYVKNEILGPSAKLPNIFHWSPAELTFMGVANDNLEGDEVGMLGNIYKERREMIENWKTLPWFDFLKVMKDEPIVVKGAFGFGLKAIAKKLEEHRLTKTTWKDGPVDGLGAMVGAWYCDRISREQGIDMDRTELMQGIREYNIIDCKAMWDLINYLRKHHT